MILVCYKVLIVFVIPGWHHHSSDTIHWLTCVFERRLMPSVMALETSDKCDPNAFPSGTSLCSQSSASDAVVAAVVSNPWHALTVYVYAPTCVFAALIFGVFHHDLKSVHQELKSVHDMLDKLLSAVQGRPSWHVLMRLCVGRCHGKSLHESSRVPCIQ